MITYYVKRNSIYEVLATVKCEVRDANGETFTRCEAGKSITFLAPTSKISLTDDNAVLRLAMDKDAMDATGVTNHINDQDKHVSATDRANWNESIAHIRNDVPKLLDHASNDVIHVTEDEKVSIGESARHIADSTLHERVLNIVELFPNAGSGDKFDQFTLTQAVSRANDYLSLYNLTSKVKGGLKVKYKNSLGDYVSYTWDGIGELTNPSSWHNAEINHMDNNEIHVTEDDRVKWNKAAQYGGFVGEIKHYSGNVIPEGYLVCNGSAVSRTEYADLFAAIGTTWGEGDGVDTFNLPDLIDRVIWGADTAGDYLEAGLPNIEGTLTVKTGSSTYGRLTTTGVLSTTTGTVEVGGSSSAMNESIPHTATLDASKSSEVYGKSSTVQPPAAKLIPIIKY